MPYVNIKVTKEGVTAGQKAEIIKGVTDLLAKVLAKNPATTFVVIDEVDTDNWGIGGEPVAMRRQPQLGGCVHAADRCVRGRWNRVVWQLTERSQPSHGRDGDDT